ncbi:MAG: DNA-binding transcriptional regulator OxyR [Proteobacteria bacterium]|nr:DNA-binding transcriptional regulator OxyR [Pseudomonadota bacterium]
MNLRDLEYLLAVHELQHFTKAAEKCFVSQPTLSGQIRKMEDEFGIEMIERSTRNVIFTTQGEQIVEQALKVLQEVKTLKAIAKEATDAFSGEFHVGLIPTVGPYLLPHIVPAIGSEFPNLELFLYELKTQDLLLKLDNGKLDCGILARLDGMQQYDSIHLYDEPMLLAAPLGHVLAVSDPAAQSCLEGQTVLMLEDGHCLRDQALGYCFAAGANEDQHFRATSLNTLEHMVAQGSGITVLPKLAKSASGNALIVYRPFEDPEPTREIVLLRRSSSTREKLTDAVADLVAKTTVPLL